MAEEVKRHDERGGIKKAGEWLKQHPSVLIGVATVFGVSGEQVAEILTLDVPGWVAGVLVILWAAVNYGRETLNSFRSVERDVAEMKQALKDGTDRFNAHSKMLNRHDAEIAAHEEEIARIRRHVKLETDKVEKDES